VFQIVFTVIKSPQVYRRYMDNGNMHAILGRHGSEVYQLSLVFEMFYKTIKKVCFSNFLHTLHVILVMLLVNMSL